LLLFNGDYWYISNRKKEWIPAFAGMTSFAGMTGCAEMTGFAGMTSCAEIRQVKDGEERESSIGV